MPPSADDLKVAIGALRDAAKEWDRQGGELTTISSNAQTLQMSALEFGLVAPLRGAYEQVRSGLQALLSEAAGEAHAIGSALTKAADVYQREEDAGVHKLKQIW